MYKRIVDFVKGHKLLIVLAVLAGIIYVAPNIAFMSQDNYQGVSLSSLDGEIFYLARMQEVIDGHKDYTSTYFYEYKEGNEGIYQYSDMLIGYFLRFTKIDLISFFVFSKFFFTIISFMLWYYLAFLICKNKLNAILASSLLFFGNNLFEVLNVFEQLKIIFSSSDNLFPLVFGRFPSPVATYPLFVLGLIYAFQYFKNNTIKNAIIFGLLVSLNLYLYIFFGIYLLALAGVIALYLLIAKKKQVVKSHIVLFGTMLLSGSYYLYAIFNVMFLEAINESTSDTLSIYSLDHTPLLPKIVIMSCMILIGYLVVTKYFKKQVSRGVIFLMLLFVTTVATLNQQILTGKLVEDGHFHWYINKPIFYLVLSMIFFWILKILQDKMILNRLFFNIIIGLIIIYTIVFSMSVQASSYKNYYDMYDGYQVYAPFFNWLNEHSNPEDVVLAESKLSLLIPAYTKNNIYLAKEFPIHFNTYPYERRIDSFCLALYMDEGDFAKDKLTDIDSTWPHYNSYTYFNYYDSSIPDNLSRDIVSVCSESFNKPLDENLKKYRLDYIIWDKNINPNWPIAEISGLQEVFSQGDIVLYEVLK